jgi:hypothetical protein
MEIHTDGSSALNGAECPAAQQRELDVERLWFAVIAAGVYRPATAQALDLVDLIRADDRGVDVRGLL